MLAVGDDQRDVVGQIAPQVVAVAHAAPRHVVEVFAVIAEQHHDGVARQAVLVETPQQEGDRFVDGGHRAAIQRLHLPRLGRRQRRQLRQRLLEVAEGPAIVGIGELIPLLRGVGRVRR